jgi:hypothetical protein
MNIESLGRALVFILSAALVSGGAPGQTPVKAQDAAVEAATGRADVVGVGSHNLNAASLERLRDLGVRHVRTTLYWSHWSDAAYRETFTRTLREAVAAGFTPLVLVHQQPSGGYSERQRIYRDYARFIAARVAEFPEVRYWQLWNEMDVAFTDVFGAGHPDVPQHRRGGHYAEMLRLAYPAIKQANPQAVVVTGGIASGIGDGFLEGMYAGGARFDVLAIHSYGFPLWLAYRERGVQARAMMQAHGDPRPLWNTEFGLESAVVAPGWPSAPRDIDGYHLDAWRTSVEGNAREGIYDRIYGHVLEQGGDLSYDLIRSNGSPRPAYLWLRSWLRAS